MCRRFLSLLLHVDSQVQLVELLLLEWGRGIQHHVASAIVLGEGDAITDTVEAGEERYPTVETVCKTSVRGCTVLEGIQQEAELLLCLFGGEAEDSNILACNCESWIRIEPPPTSTPFTTMS